MQYLKYDKSLEDSPALLKHWALFAKSGDSIYHNSSVNIGYHARHPDPEAFVTVLHIECRLIPHFSFGDDQVSGLLEEHSEALLSIAVDEKLVWVMRPSDNRKLWQLYEIKDKKIWSAKKIETEIAQPDLENVKVTYLRSQKKFKN